MRRQILHHFSWASIRKVWVYMLSTGYGAKNDAKLTAVCISAAKRIGDWVLGGRAAARIEGRLRRAGLTRHEASSTQHMPSARATGARQRREVVRRRPSRDTEPALERRVRGTEKA